MDNNLEEEDSDNLEDDINYEDILDNYKELLERYNINTCTCKHYNNNCKIHCTICNKVYNCWKCHNKICSEHKLEQRDVTNISCTRCNKMQKLGLKCENCDNFFGSYICFKCKIIDSKYNYNHCDKCGYCMDIFTFNEHICIENIIDDNCSVCLEKIINNGKIKKMMCNHIIHESCYNNLIKNSDKCPLCVKTIYIDLEKIEILNKKLLKNNCDDDKYVDIYCRDCEKKFNVEYNDIALKCPKCKLFNCLIL